MKNNNIKFIAESAIIAALYAALTWIFAPISYGPIQFRISEILVLLVVLNPKYAVSLILGCFIANTTSSLGWYDMLFGTLATTLAIIPMIYVRKMPIAALFPVISNAIIVPIELGFAFDMWGVGFWYNVWTVGLGELVVLYFLAIPVMSVISKNEALVSTMELDSSKSLDLHVKTKEVLAIILSILGIILFIAYPMYAVKSADEEIISFSMLSIAKSSYWLWIMLGLVIIYSLAYIFIHNIILKKVITLLIVAAVIALYILVGINNTQCFKYVYYYIFVIYPVLLILLPINTK